jgi:hypothetical protein
MQGEIQRTNRRLGACVQPSQEKPNTQIDS